VEAVELVKQSTPDIKEHFGCRWLTKGNCSEKHGKLKKKKKKKKLTVEPVEWSGPLL
jgi:hypothetical protein